MIRLCSRLLAVLVLWLMPLAGMARDLVVVSWNLQWFPGRTPYAKAAVRAKHMAAVQAKLKALNPDILLVQEVTDEEAFRELVSVLPDLKVHVVSDFPKSEDMPRAQQLAIASRFPARSAWASLWEGGTNRPPRGYAFAAVETAPDRLLMVYSVHLKSNRTEPGLNLETCMAMREEAVRQLVEHQRMTAQDLHPDGQLPCVVGGDFNTNQDGTELAADRTLALMAEAGFTDAWQRTPRSRRLTWMGSRDFAPTTFDYIFTRGVTVGHIETIDIDRALSDHRPVLGMLRMAPPQAAHTQAMPPKVLAAARP